MAGVVDRPFEQRRDALWADLSGAAGHVGVAGGPRERRSTMLGTLICSLALLHTPEEVQFYCLDFGGGTVGAVAGLPHVGGVATRQQADRVRRTVAELQAPGGPARARVRQPGHRVDRGLPEHAGQRGRSPVMGSATSSWWWTAGSPLRQEYEQLETAITALAARALGYGVHVIAATNKWSEFRPGIRDLLGTKFELRLGDPYNSEMGRALAMNVPRTLSRPRPDPGRPALPDRAAEDRRPAAPPTAWRTRCASS